jgi:translocation and assembly module TamA
LAFRAPIGYREGCATGGQRVTIRPRFTVAAVALAALLALASAPAHAQEVAFAAPGADADLNDRLRGASLTLARVAEGPAPASDIVAAARADYGRLLGALYAAGHYSGVISVRIDGREVAEIPVLDLPDRVGRVDIVVQPGPPFRFARAEIAPLAPGTELPEGFAAGRPAPSDILSEAARAGVDGWREVGHAKADVAAQQITADHRRATLDAAIRLDPGPRLRFGRLEISGNERVRTERIREIAGLREGRVFSPEELRKAAERLRRTGAFRSVTLREAERIGPGDLLPIEALVDEERPRRFGAGAEVSSAEGLRLTGFWLHRNLLGGAERLRIGGEIAGIGGETGGNDYRVTLSFARPGTFSPDTTLTFDSLAELRQEPDYEIKAFEVGAGLARIFSDERSGSVGIGYRQSRVEDAAGTTDFRLITFPVTYTWDRRDDRLNPTEGFFLDARVTPFLGLDGTGSGARVQGDARVYRGLGDGGRVVLAARLQYGGVFGPDLAQTPREFLFYSGGGGTVRGQSYQSLAVEELPGGVRSGGQQFLGLQAEARVRVTDRIGVVAFADWGAIAAEMGDSVIDHAGAGLGLRYDTGIGPIRLDIAAPIGGDGDGVQIYIGIGQAF